MKAKGFYGLSGKQIEAMEALFAFSEAMTSGRLTAIDLAEVIEKAVDEGHDMLVIQLAMAIRGVTLTQEARKVRLSE